MEGAPCIFVPPGGLHLPDKGTDHLVEEIAATGRTKLSGQRAVFPHRRNVFTLLHESGENLGTRGGT